MSVRRAALERAHRRPQRTRTVAGVQLVAIAGGWRTPGGIELVNAEEDLLPWFAVVDGKTRRFHSLRAAITALEPRPGGGGGS